MRKWQQKIRTEERHLDREIRQIDVAQAKAKAQLKQLATKGDVKNARMLAREVVRSNKQKDRLYTSKARLNSIRMQLQHQLGTSECLLGRMPTLIRDRAITATLKITGTLQKSTEIMKLSNDLIKLPQLNKSMQEMSREMMKVRDRVISISSPVKAQNHHRVCRPE